MSHTPYKERSRRLSAAERTKQILDAAVEVFSVRGYRSSAFREVADACSVTEPLIYKYFRSRKDLFIEAVNHAACLVLEAWRDAASAWADPLSKLRVLGNAELAQRVCRLSGGILLQARADAGHDQDISQAVAQGVTLRLEFIERLVKTARDQGLIHADTDVRQLSWQALSVLFSSAVIARLDVGHPCPERLIDLVLSRVATEKGRDILVAQEVAA